MAYLESQKYRSELKKDVVATFAIIISDSSMGIFHLIIEEIIND